MAIALASALLYFIVSLVISAVVIYLGTKLFGETEGFGTAILAALIGAIIYAIASFLLGGGLLASIIGGVAWLIALGSLYKMGWLKAFIVAVVIWVISMLVGLVLPTVTGPL